MADEAPFQFTHPGRGATPYAPSGHLQRIFVSIHAPREGCDSSSQAFSGCKSIVSIHAPREGCDKSKRPISG